MCLLRLNAELFHGIPSKHFMVSKKADVESMNIFLVLIIKVFLYYIELIGSLYVLKKFLLFIYFLLVVYMF